MAAASNAAQRRADNMDDENLEEMASFFSLRKPKNAKAGLASGSKNFVKGVVAGAVNLVAAPVIGAQQEGLKGFAMGVGAGTSTSTPHTYTSLCTPLPTQVLSAQWCCR